MPDTRRHRGPHPRDQRLFAPDMLDRLNGAVAHLSWLQTHGYATRSSIQLVGNRFDLVERQRRAVVRCACSDGARRRRAEVAVAADDLIGQPLLIDGYNVLTSVEAALAGGVILNARDGAFRDMASMYGSYRTVNETRPAIDLIGHALGRLGVDSCRWLLDSPVSNSGRLRGVMLEVAEVNGWDWTVDLVPNPDPLLIASDCVVATADSGVLDRCGRQFALARFVIERSVPDARVIDMTGSLDS
jgi:hypothetical protein